MGIKHVLKKSLLENRHLILAAFLWCVSNLILAFHYGAKFSELSNIVGSPFQVLGNVMMMYSILAVMTYVYHFFGALKDKCGSLNACRKEMITRSDRTFSDYFDSKRIFEGLILLIFLLFMLQTVGLAKSLVAHIHPYVWDPEFAEIDCKIHFGSCPQYLLAPWVEKISAQGVIDTLYTGWFWVMLWSYWYAAFIDTDKIRRKTFLWSSLFGWVILGWAMAAVFSSVGPIYFGEFYPDAANPYAPYIDHLKEVYKDTPMSVIDISAILLEVSRDPNVIDINGITAMPSMHVAVITLITWYFWQINRLVGLLLLLFTFVIMISSVYLAWHYAIDGYASFILASLIWVVCNRVLKRRST